MAQEISYIISFSCPDQMGITAAASGFLFEQGFNIVESAQFEDRNTRTFFFRAVVEAGDNSPNLSNLRAAFQATAKRFKMNWQICDAAYQPKILLMVSKFGHCLNDLLFRQSVGGIKMDIVGVVSNHVDHEKMVTSYDVPFHYLPVTRETKLAQEEKLVELIEDTGTDLVVLARYMQVFTTDLCNYLSERAINIHHSFLPSFKGARPYQQAHQRGVKLIGATAHYVTLDLDEGPIIEQEVARVTHSTSVDQMAATGRDLENIVLARAVKAHCENRVLLNGDKTVVL